MRNVEIGTNMSSVILSVETELLEDKNKLKKYIWCLRSSMFEAKLTSKKLQKSYNLSNSTNGIRIIMRLLPRTPYKKYTLASSSPLANLTKLNSTLNTNLEIEFI